MMVHNNTKITSRSFPFLIIGTLGRTPWSMLILNKVKWRCFKTRLLIRLKKKKILFLSFTGLKEETTIERLVTQYMFACLYKYLIKKLKNRA